ncbi:serine hydrolase domain-containing protein [Qipengyuania sphaerica]|uniref:serine hydrolase domain-containing protein n=1 Tax=Qipengyuania sphaerica TaxID=2867243 RepID=UPI001C88C005|nr:serine hydrolase domain-containing protein [Qipengyuania sphaerica]MBX7539767.1 beta-lactamase family protein [Qipengyuania sphaerica]
MRTIVTIACLVMLTGCANQPAPSPAASVAVVFDRYDSTTVIVEGLADRETGRPVEANDPVRIASISKLVMAIAALELVEEGKLEVDADVSQHLGFTLRHPDHPDVPITLPMLLSHRSGLRDTAGYVIPLGESLEDHLKQPEAWYRGSPPGEAPFEYANIGSPVVATILEGASGERFDRLVQRLVFEPLAIDACFNWIGCPQGMADRAVTLYRSNGEIARDDPADRPPNCTIPVADDRTCSLDAYEPGTNASVFSPQGGLRIGMRDLARLGAELLKPAKESVFSERALDELFLSLTANSEAQRQHFFCIYGFHVQLIELSGEECDDALVGDGRSRLGHAGEAYGLRSGLWLDYEAGTGIAYFVTQVPDRTAPDEGGFAFEEVILVRRALRIKTETGN